MIPASHVPIAAQAGARSWSLGHEGIPPWLALFFILLLAVGTFHAYSRWAPGIRGWRKRAMIAFRVLSILILVFLLTKPVLHRDVEQTVREPLLVLVDGTESMTFSDPRDQPEDRMRAAIATGAVNPEAGSRRIDSETVDPITISRIDLLRQLAANRKIDLWRRLSEHADLSFYEFGREPFVPPGAPRSPDGTLTAEDAASFFEEFEPAAEATALGESIRRVLQEPRSRSPGGIFLITDGVSNTGSSAIEAAQIAAERDVPLYVYGVGVASPLDLVVRNVDASKLAFAGEKNEVTARILAENFPEQRVTAILTANGLPVAEREITLGRHREHVVAFPYTPTSPGEVELEVRVPVLPGEAGEENNVATNTMRVTDQKFQVLLIEQEPRWDFRYLLDYLQRDESLDVKCVMIDGEPGLADIPDSPFLPGLPESRETFYQSHVLILGDVDPRDLGLERMAIIADWVESGGGIIFLTGSNHNPRGYVGTPLEALLPVVPDTVTPEEWASQRAPEPFPLELTRLGRESPYLEMDPAPEVNRKIWDQFPGVRWTAPVTRVKSGAEVLLVDPRPEREGRYGQLPVFAMQGFGAGRSVYLGTDETYRWRSRTGDKYYSILWGQIMQTLSLQLLEGASPLTQLKSDRRRYATGDRVVIQGPVYEEGFTPLVQPTLDGALSIDPHGEGSASSESFHLENTGENNYRGDFVPRQPGSYHFVTERDPDGVVRFDVVDARLEYAQTAMDARRLQAMADTSGGRFLREEDLHGLPDLIVSQSATVTTFEKIRLYHSAWFLAALLLFLFLEWWMRRRTRLK